MRALAELRTGEGVLVPANGAFQLHGDGSVFQDPLTLIQKATIQFQETGTITLKAGDTAELRGPFPVPEASSGGSLTVEESFRCGRDILPFAPLSLINHILPFSGGKLGSREGGLLWVKDTYEGIAN
jgi:hypothetical protein